MADENREDRSRLDHFILNLRHKTTGEVYDEPIGVRHDEYVNDVISSTIRDKNVELLSIMDPDRSCFQKPAPTADEWEAANVRLVVNLRAKSDGRLFSVDHAATRGYAANTLILAVLHDADVVSILNTDGSPYQVDAGSRPQSAHQRPED